MPPRAPLALLVTLAAGAAGLALAACGGSSPAASVAKDSEAQLVRFARCMREHGVNVSTPSGSPDKLRAYNVNPQTMEAAQNACKRYRPFAQRMHLTPQERVAREEAVRKFAQCMREHGVDVHASTTNGGFGIQIQAHAPSGAGPNKESPGFQAAQKACQGLLPRPKGAPGSPPPGGLDSSGSARGGGPSMGFQVGG